VGQPFTLSNIKDLEDLGPRFDGAPDLEFPGAPNLGDDPRKDVDGERDWWAN
jgi:hypothetical protein